MAALDIFRRLPPWALYGGAGVAAGGGYWLYRRRRAASGSAAQKAPAATAVQSALDTGAQFQQPSIVPYYLTDQSAAGAGSSATMTQRRPPKTHPASIPSATGAGTTTGTLPDIAPLLPVSPPAATPVPPAAGPPAQMPAPQNNNLPADLLARIQAGGEQIVSSLAAPGGGQWYLGSKGGVFAINAPFYGAAAGQPYFAGRKAIQLVPNGKGYTVVDATGSRYDYSG